MTVAPPAPTAEPPTAATGDTVAPEPAGTVLPAQRVTEPDIPAAGSTGGGESTAWYVVRTTLTMVALSCLSLVLALVVFSPLQHASAQYRLHEQFRTELANGVAPVQPVSNGMLLAAGTPVGLLQIPDLAVSEVIEFGTTSGVLTDGPGLRRDSALPGQSGTSIVLGRAAAYGGPFGDLDQLRPGAILTVTTGQGVQRYTVVAVRRAGDPLPPPASSGSRLTLVTATGSAFLPSGLLRVDADLVSDVQPTAAPGISAGQLQPAERALAGDPSIVWYLVFALQAELLAALAAVVAWHRWGRMQAWVVFGPLMLLAAWWVAENVTDLLPNLT